MLSNAFYNSIPLNIHYFKLLTSTGTTGYYLLWLKTVHDQVISNTYAKPVLTCMFLLICPSTAEKLKGIFWRFFSLEFSHELKCVKPELSIFQQYVLEMLISQPYQNEAVMICRTHFAAQFHFCWHDSLYYLVYKYLIQHEIDTSKCIPLPVNLILLFSALHLNKIFLEKIKGGAFFSINNTIFLRNISELWHVASELLRLTKFWF